MELEWKDHIKLGSLLIKNRICMAALTRQRCNPLNGIPNDLMAQYYTQRAGAGIILTEATAWAQRGQAFPGAACLYNKDQAQGWKKIVKSVHQKDCKIYIQLFHAGRATHPTLTRGLEPRGPSPIAVRQTIRALDGVQYPVPIEMTLEHIKQVKQQFEESVKLTKQCEFDGIQIHAAHGYLIDTFLRTSSNKRKDEYGGSVQNRCKFPLQIIDIALKYYQPQQLGLKVSPVSRLRDMIDQNPKETYSYFFQQLSKRNIGFIQIRQSTEDAVGPNHYKILPKEQIENVSKTLRPYFKGILIANDSFNPQTGLNKIRNGQADMISFGRLYISNPDLAERIIQGHEVNYEWDRKTFYGFQYGEKGYTDYTRYKQ